MNELSTQEQINQINTKLDVLLDYVNQQRLKAETVEDLISDASIIGKDIYDSTVTELENQAVEIDPDALRILGVKLIKNINNFNMVLEMFESLTDLSKDAMPIVNEMLIDGTKKLNEFEQKGYFDFIQEAGKIIDNIVTHFTTEDIEALADNIVPILETVKKMTQPDLLKSIDNAVKIFSSLETKNIPPYSVWKLLKEMRTPEMKRSLGIMVQMIKNISHINN
ncbi:MAG: DUF1641 domain-containing protein [Chlorobi bacterium]|nr:DUF1641 domain-containing protein [Chlorobiota bacterium]